MNEYRPTIGLEIHAELKTVTKMFCACVNDPDEKSPNTNICPVCMAHPGSLPAINREAVKKVLLVGTALSAQLADFSEFDRKNYFYPDIPKGYQISQYMYPLVQGGVLNSVAITRVHLEEDTARSQHLGDTSIVDFNRAGVPLMELVTEPVIHTAQEASAFARELQLLLRTLGVGEAHMEKGEMRGEANISVSAEEGKLGTKVEVKNLNSFRSVERAIAYEIERQIALIESGGEVVQETRGWDEGKQITFSQRKKESSNDYRYFPEPDLPRLKLSDLLEFSYNNLKKELPELPWEKRDWYTKQGISKEYSDVFIADEELGRLYANTATIVGSGMRTTVANYIGSDIAGLISTFGEEGLKHITPEGLAVVVNGISKNEISSRGAKDALQEVFVSGGDLAEVSKNYLQQSDVGALAVIAQKVIDANPDVVAEYKAGKTPAVQFLIGQGMKESKGSANPQALRDAIQKVLA